jgi:acylglycerol lipase
MEIRIKLSKGQVLRGMIRSPGEKMRAGIMLVHGVGEHTGRYSHWVERFLANGIGFVAVDLPGHGKSDGKRGHISSYHKVNEMLDLVIAEFKKTFPGVPLFIYGHSLGGGIALQYILQKKPSLKGAIITSPWLRLSYEPAKAKLVIAGIMRVILPALTQPSGLVVSHLSHDRVVVDAYKADPLTHDKISVALFHSAVKAAEYSLAHAQDLGMPLLIMHGSDDQICSPAGSSEFASKSSLAELKIWEGGYHELHNEIFKDEVFSYIIKWIEKQL